MMNSGVSIIICCYNSTNYLLPTLQHACNQDASTIPNWEVIVVDNNSSDKLDDFIREAEVVNKNKIRCIREPTPGLANARRKGIAYSRFRYAIFCDDDNWLNHDFIKKVFETFEQNPDIGIIAPNISAVFNQDVIEPEWFKDNALHYAVGKQGAKTGDITNRGFVWGAGMSLRKDVFQKLLEIDLKSLLSDRKGNMVSSGGDSEISLWYMIAGYKLWFIDELRLKHNIQNSRLNTNYLERLINADDNNTYEILASYNTFYAFYYKFSFSKRFLYLIKSVFYYFLREKTIFHKCYLTICMPWIYRDSFLIQTNVFRNFRLIRKAFH